MSSKDRKRPYRKRRRAAAEEATRQRITEAAIELHGTLGPARTTISGVAERAGVQRATVYRHFPDEASLFAACSGHWAALHPPPDPGAWAAIADPQARLRVALGELYSWYEQPAVESMLENVTRDLPLVPSMRAAYEGFRGWYAVALEALMHGRPERGARRRRARAAVGHALEFETWRSLARRQGLGREQAVDLAGALAGCA